MNSRDFYSQPPHLQSPPPASPLDTNRSYRWTSMTAANCEKYNFEGDYCDSAKQKTPERRKADTSWLSPSRGDTWRVNPSRGRILNIAAAFGQIAQKDDSKFFEKRANFTRRIRQNSEPNQENEREIVQPNFIDDSMIQSEEDEQINEEVRKNIANDYFDRETLAMRRESEYDNQSFSNSCNNVEYHRSTVEHVINEECDIRKNENIEHYPAIIDDTPKRPNMLTARTSIRSLNMEKLESGSDTNGFVTSTPQNLKNGSVHDVNTYFGHEESIRASPLTRRERRGTQAIVLPQNFDSPRSEKKFKVPKLPVMNCDNRKSVQSIADGIEKIGFGGYKKIDAASEIAEMKRKEAEEHARKIEEQNRYLDKMDENSNVVDDEENAIPRVSHTEMRPSIQMGVSGYELRRRDQEDADYIWRENAQEDFYSVPRKGRLNGVTDDGNEINEHPSSYQKMMRQSLPFSDIPEEKTYEKIDEMFDFVEKTSDFDEKTLERTNGYAEMDDNHNSPYKGQRSLDVSKLAANNLSTNTYQEMEFDKSNTPYVEYFDGSGSSGGPQFTRSPTLMTPHAGQSVTEYRVSEKEGRPRTEKIVVNKGLTPSALATSTPMGTVAARKILHTNNPEESFVSSISDMSNANKANDSRKQISRLIEMIERTRKHINLAEIALIDAKKAKMVVQELSAQRVLLVCRERLKLQLDEVRRLQALSVVRYPPPPLNRHFKSTMVISNIAVHLNKNFNYRGSFAFIVVMKCRTEIESTAVVTLFAQYQTRLNVIHFTEQLHFSNLPVDFVITMEVYMMRVPEYKPPEKTCASVLAQKCRNLLVPSTAHRRPKSRKNKSLLSTSPGHQSPECDFKFCGKLTLDRDSAGDKLFYLDDITYPLEGTVKLLSHCSSLPEAIDVEYRGYLYMYDEKCPNGGSSWERYWAMLNRGIIFFWKAPADEKAQQVPLAQIDLTKCTNQSIDEMKSEKTSKPHMFMIELLIDQTPTFLEKRRVLLSAESRDNMTSWLNAINDTLLVLRF